MNKNEKMWKFLEELETAASKEPRLRFNATKMPSRNCELPSLTFVVNSTLRKCWTEYTISTYLTGKPHQLTLCAEWIDHRDPEDYRSDFDVLTTIDCSGCKNTKEAINKILLVLKTNI